MFRIILLLIAVSLPVSSYSQRVTENLVQGLYYLDGENYKVYSYDKTTKSAVEIKLIPLDLLNESKSPYVAFDIPIENGRRYFRFACEVVESSMQKPNPIATCINSHDAITVMELTKDSINNTSTFNFSRYRFASQINVFFLNELLEYPKELTCSSKSVSGKDVQIIGNITTTKNYNNDVLSSQTVSKELPNGDKKEYFTCVVNKKNKMKKPYSTVSLIQYRGDSTITTKNNVVSRYGKYSNVSKHEKYIKIKDEKGNLTFEGKYIGRRRLREKKLEYSPEYKIEYKYFGKTLERRTIKKPTGTTLIEIRRKYSE
jgi:hypothetical protein